MNTATTAPAVRRRFRVRRWARLAGMRPQVVAHRGASFENAEHTLGAYSRRSATGPRRSSATSGSPPTATWSASTTATSGVRRARTGLVSTMELADLDQLEFASWKNPWAALDDEAERPRPRPRPGAHPAPAARDGRRGGPARSSWRSRPSTRRGTAGWSSAAWSRRSPTSAGRGPDSPVRVMSFSYVALQRMQRLAPGPAAGDADREGAALADAQAGGRGGLDPRARASTS